MPKLQKSSLGRRPHHPRKRHPHEIQNQGGPVLSRAAWSARRKDLSKRRLSRERSVKETTVGNADTKTTKTRASQHFCFYYYIIIEINSNNDDDLNDVCKYNVGCFFFSSHLPKKMPRDKHCHDGREISKPDD
mmetsp:Transcript_20735/g.29914  ORF Transcript_20735/g.29914 Transcript_20735/m.29914 type:complete len:133 (-) Transcript_20735:86-484(-)